MSTTPPPMTSNAARNPAFSFTISPGRPIWLLAWAIAALSLLSIAGHVVAQSTGYDFRPIYIYLRLFNVDAENTIPSWFSCIQLLFCALAIWTLASRLRREGARRHRQWTLLAVVFAYLSLDEGTGIHERTIPILQDIFPFDGALYFAWVVLAIPAVIIFGFAYLRFLLELPARTKRGFIAAAAVYVGGGIGVEMISSAIFTSQHVASMTYQITAGVEEAMEMSGVLMLLATVASYVQSRWPDGATLQE